MSMFQLRPRQASMVWLEPHRVHAGGNVRFLYGLPTEDQLAQSLSDLPLGPTKWVVDDLWAPSVLLRDIVELPAGAEARESFFRWRYSQSLALETEASVQSLSIGEDVWLLAGIEQELRESWIQLSLRLGRPIHSLIPRWLWLYNRLAPTREVPGMLLSLCSNGEGEYSGSLVAWGRTLVLLRQWSDPASPDVWMQERVSPSAAYLQRDGKSPQELWIWGSPVWPEGSVPHRIVQPEIPAQEGL